MKKKYYWIIGIIILIGIFSLFIYFSTPAPSPKYLFVLNTENKSCATFVEGIGYQLPSGWKSYQVISRDNVGNGIISTDIGTCIVNESGYQGCCDQLGYNYISNFTGEKT